MQRTKILAASILTAAVLIGASALAGGIPEKFNSVVVEGYVNVGKATCTETYAEGVCADGAIETNGNFRTDGRATFTGLTRTGTSACSTATGAGDLCINGDLDVTGSLGLGATTLSSLIVTGATDLRGTMAFGNAAADYVTITGTVAGATPICFDGGTPGTNKTCFTITDPTAVQNINIPDGAGTLAVSASSPLSLSAAGALSLGVVPATLGGTGQSSYAVGDLPYADTTTSLGKLAAVAAGSALISAGVNTAPAWGTPALAATATALAADPADCAANQFANTIAASGALTCAAISDADVPDGITITLAGTATALAADPADCGANAFAQSIAASGALTCASIADADVPNTITIDLATNASNLNADPTDCGSNQFAQSIDAQGDLTCGAISDADVPDGITVTLAGTATALAADPADCAANQFATTIAASGALTCAAISDADVPDGITVTLAGTATALAADPADCGANAFAQSIAASGALTCAGIADADVPNTITIDYAAASGTAGTATALAADPADCAAGEYAKSIAASGALTCETVSYATAAGSATSATSAAGLSATLVETSGGTNQTTYTTGDMLYASGANTLGKLAAGTATYVLTANGAGVAPSWQAAAGGVAAAAYYGDGSDGAGAPCDGSTATLTRNIYCTTFAVGAGESVNTAGYAIYSQNPITIAATGLVSFSGTVGAAGAAGLGGAGGAALTSTQCGGSAAGAAGGNAMAAGTNGNASSPGLGGNSGDGMDATSAGGTGETTVALTSRPFLGGGTMAQCVTLEAGSTVRWMGGSGGAGGGSTATEGGGGGGSGAGAILMAAPSFDIDGDIEAIGGGGGAGEGLAGGGGGGGGGVVILIGDSTTGSAGAVYVTGGPAGAGGSCSGGAGTCDGSAGYKYLYSPTAGTVSAIAF